MCLIRGPALARLCRTCMRTFQAAADWAGPGLNALLAPG